ncbi:DUF7373 family lipoprotein [Nocardia iowensis]|uniref:Uncharacterized protein n=1 Tax=Nocardia iowensis TaxID=204891 RepID=A0ABX8RSC6_NOCIO|nr:hypothetical protein [Nocardia iowensis]QXN92542.1 hypothetical protein KV110_05180 [Nocardia iowensis]
MRKSLRTLAAALAVLSVSTAGCGSDSAASDSTPLVDIGQLDVGSYATTPREIGKPGLDRARLTEGQRLASFVPLPMDIDPRFTIQSGSDTNAIRGFIETVYTIGISGDSFRTNTPGFTAGFYSLGYSEHDILIATSLENTVLLFSDQQAATLAAAALAQTVAAEKGLSEPVDISKHRDALASWKPGTQELYSFQASGQYVIYTAIKDAAKKAVGTVDLPAMVELAEKSLDAIATRLRAFRPTPPDKLTDVPLDHDGMFGRSLPRPNEDAWRNPPGLYDADGALHLSNDPVRDKKLFGEAGVDWMANYAGHLYRAANPEGAQDIRDSHGALSRIYRRIDAPKNLPDARCRELRVKNLFVPRFHCVVSFDRYTGEVWSHQLIDVHQRISAQYAILAKAK